MTDKQWEKFYWKQVKIASKIEKLNAKIDVLLQKRDKNYREYYEKHGKEWLAQQEQERKTREAKAALPPLIAPNGGAMMLSDEELEILRKVEAK